MSRVLDRYLLAPLQWADGGFDEDGPVFQYKDRISKPEIARNLEVSTSAMPYQDTSRSVIKDIDNFE
jgi:hypothetical protein